MRFYELGLSAQAIAGSGIDHPWDPGDLRRCMEYCERGLTTEKLRIRMAGRSRSWDLLLPEWDNLIALLRHEIAVSTNGKAPRTYHEMKRVLADGVKCAPCDGTGRGENCPKCKGTGNRNGGRCRADGCSFGAYFCPACRGYGYTRKKEA